MIYYLIPNGDYIKYNLKDIIIEVNKRSETCATILKFIIHTLVEERKIIIEEDKKVEFLSQFDRLIDSCISLLNFKRMPPGFKSLLAWGIVASQVSGLVTIECIGSFSTKAGIKPFLYVRHAHTHPVWLGVLHTGISVK